MSALNATREGSARPVVSAQARALAARLSALFEQRLNDAQHRLRNANERLWSGLHPDAFGVLYDGAAPAGHSHIARLLDDAPDPGEPGAETALLCALQDAHWTIHRAFCEYQSACEERRQLAVEVGELAERLTSVLCAAGWSEHAARDANVHQLAGARSPATGHQEPAL